ncbi:MAG TPA: integrase [Gammaproteobacteria bacterium]|nr:integrase [Gammaproteobacteria bacterium]
MIQYVYFLRKQYDNPATINRIIHALKQYYFFLIEIKKREDHPCRNLKIKLNTTAALQLQDLLTQEQLEQLPERRERYENLGLRNRVVMSLLLHQALRPIEIAAIKMGDINLEKGEIQIRATKKTNARILPLKPEQIMLFYNYKTEARPTLLKKKKSEYFIINQRGGRQTKDNIHYLVSTYQDLLPGKKLTPTTIRQSVIANLLKQGKDLRIVQYFAGHKQPSATERYRQNNLEELRSAVNKYHPLDKK